MGTRLEEALDRISEIHAHLDKGEVYRGYRSVPVALSGLCALAAAWLYPWIGGVHFVTYWVSVAVASFVICSGGIVCRYLANQTAVERQSTRRVFVQLLPSLVAGAIATAVLAQTHAGLLPGLWAMFFALAVVSMRPYLPRGMGWLALYYLGAGALLLVQGEASSSTMGATFGCGQLGAALLLYWNIERGGDG